jgi:hypothetical protein
VKYSFLEEGSSSVTDNKGADRRQHARYKLKDRIFITFRPQFDRIGWLTDISKGGVCLEYPTIQEYSELSNNVHVDIFSAPNSFKLTNLHCKLVYDSRIDMGKGFMEAIETRRCGLVFGDLSKQQFDQLNLALNNYTVEERSKSS